MRPVGCFELHQCDKTARTRVVRAVGHPTFQFESIPIDVGLVRTGDRNSQVLGLFFRQLG